jgi:uncharacterized protein YdcH (DUF465 family)
MMVEEIKTHVLRQLEETEALDHAIKELTGGIGWLYVALDNLEKTSLKKETSRLKRLTAAISKLQSDLILRGVL